MKNLLFILVLTMSVIQILAQAPQGFQYQSVVRNSVGDPIPNQQVGFRISLISGSVTGTIEYSEIQNVNTNQFGIAILNIGNGTPETGSFSSINWGMANHFIKVEADPTGGTTYLDMGTTQLLSVPYALYSENSGDTIWAKNGSNIYNSNSGNVGVGINNPSGKMVIQGDLNAPATDPLFEVKNSAGQTIFVVYPDSVHIYVKDSGGSKSNQGGFAVSGRNNAKAVTNNYLTVTPDSTRIFTGDTIAGFGVENLNTGSSTSYMHLNPSNYFIGHGSGQNIVNGIYNNVMGFMAGAQLTDGSNNSILGYRAGSNLTTGSSNIIIGYEAAPISDGMVYNTIMGFRAGYNLGNCQQNVMIGYETGYSTTTGSINTAVGSFTLHNNISGSANVAIGNNAMYSNTGGYGNTGIGNNSLYFNTNGSYNTSSGFFSMYNNTVGSNNSAYGFNSMESNIDGSDNTAIGSNAMYANLSGINNTAIGSYTLNSNTSGSYNVSIGAFCLEHNNASYNTAIGAWALSSNTSGSWNTALGGSCLRYNTTGGDNLAAGFSALQQNTTGNGNIAVGNYSLLINTVGSYNVAVGTSALNYNVDGIENVAIGPSAMLLNSSGQKNMAAGMNALYSNTTGSRNIALGHSSLYSNSTGTDNVALGYYALTNSTVSGNTALGTYASRMNTTGFSNTSVGQRAMYNNTTGNYNTVIGDYSFYTNATGNYNTAMGVNALYQSTANENTAVGYYALYRITTGQQNTAIGKDAGPGIAGSGLWCTTALGYGAQPVADYSARVGNAWLTSIGGYADWTNFSDKRYKTNVQENVPGLDFIMKLKPVTYKLDVSKINSTLGQKNDALDAERSGKENLIFTGFLAQDVEQAAKELGFNFSGVDSPKDAKSFYGLRYGTFVVPVVKAIQEQQNKIEKLEAEIEQLKALLNK